MNLIVWNENIRLALAKDYTSNYEMYLTYRDTIDPLFLTTAIGKESQKYDWN